MSGGDDVEVYTYRGKEGEKVPETVEKLLVDEGVQYLPDELCRNFQRLKHVTLPKGLIGIGDEAFYSCANLLEIRICNTIEHIGKRAFMNCELLTTAEFEFSHHLRTIDDGAFYSCAFLQSVRLPSSMTSVGESAFAHCETLIEANLSRTRVTKISEGAFSGCSLLQTVSLPNTMEQIGVHAFSQCPQLVTVVVPSDTKPIGVDLWSFAYCGRLSNFALPKDSGVHAGAFDGCDHLHELYGELTSQVATGLMNRFDGFGLHRMCYNHSATVQELLECSMVDDFEMNPFHVLFSTAEPRADMLEVLLELLRRTPVLIQLLRWRDGHSRRPLDYLLRNWTDESKSLVLRTVEKSMIEPLSRWGTASWVEDIQSKVQEMFADNDKEQRTRLCDEAYALLETYENLQTTSTLEMALWQRSLKSGWTADGTKRQARDREESRCLSGSDVVIPHVVAFLGIPSLENDWP